MTNLIGSVLCKVSGATQAVCRLDDDLLGDSKHSPSLTVYMLNGSMTWESADVACLYSHETSVIATHNQYTLYIHVKHFLISETDKMLLPTFYA